FLPETAPIFVEQLLALWEGRRRLENEAIVRTLKGKRLDIAFTVAVSPYKEVVANAGISPDDLLIVSMRFQAKTSRSDKVWHNGHSYRRKTEVLHLAMN
ncbi:MAG: hypothetical protein ACXWVS_12835, partial [Hyphomicrobium sp.]